MENKIMKYTILFIFFCCNNLIAQVSYEQHISSIKSVYLEGEDENGIFNANERAVEFAIAYLLNQGIETQYITNRQLLQKIDRVVCKDSLYTTFFKKLKNDITIEAEIRFKQFEKKNHKSEFVNYTMHVDGQIAYGSFYGLPKLEIEEIKITVNNKELKIPKTAYKNFYNIDGCGVKNFQFESMEVYSSIDGSNIYVYLFGGNAATVFLTKIIFDNEKYIGQIVIDYKEIREWRAFHNENFIGF